MIEVYLFLAMFPVQILVMSVLYPVRLTRLIRTGLKNIPAERLAELYPGVDVGQAHERFLARYRAANTVVAVLGLLLLGWFISYMQRPNWDEGAVGGMVTAYFLLQNFPIILIAWFTTRFNKVHRRLLPEAKRKAILQRRGLFDFVSPFTVFLAILAYFQFVAFMFYVARHPFPGFGGPFVNIGIVTLVYIAGCIRHVLGALWQKDRPAPDARGSHAHDRSDSEEQRLLVHRHRRVPVAQLLASTAGSEEMGTVRAEYFFRHLRAGRFHGLRRAAAQTRSG